MSGMRLRVFFVLALAVAVGLAVGVSPYASASPDGLEKVAGDKGFLDSGGLNAIQEGSPMPDYAFPGIEDPRLATGLAGFLGVIAVALIASGIGWLFHRRRAADGEQGDPAAA
jgi:hypothetical protein